MIITQKIILDLTRKRSTPVIMAKQGDANSRHVEITLLDNNEPYTIPTDTSIAVRYRKQDGTAGLYDMLPDGVTPAATYTDNILTMNIAPQMMSFPGCVETDILLTNGESLLSTFNFIIEVVKNPVSGSTLESQNYYNVVSLEQINAVLATTVRSVNGVKPDTSGNVTISVPDGGSNVSVDATLTQAGQAADAKAVGDKFDSLSEEIANISGGSGLTAAQISALDGMFKVTAFSSDPVSAYAAFKAAFGLADSGDSGSEETPDTPVTYIVTNNLDNVSSDNDSTSVDSGEAYVATLTADDGYVLDAVTVTMGGADVTSDVYADGVINIPAVTGDMVITANATEKQNTTVFTGTNLLSDVAIVDVTITQYGNGMTYGLVSDKAIALTAGTYYLYSVYKTSSGIPPKLYTEDDDGTFTDSVSAIATIARSGFFKTGIINEYGNEVDGYYQPNGVGYLAQITITLSSDFTGYLYLGASSQCYVNTEPGWTMLTTEQFNPYKQTLS